MRSRLKKGKGAIMSPRSFIAPTAFGPEALVAMGEALETVCKDLRPAGQTEAVREIIARRIIAAARFGEHDPIRLRASALRK